MPFVGVEAWEEPELEAVADTAAAGMVVEDMVVEGMVGTGPDKVPDILLPQSGRVS